MNNAFFNRSRKELFEILRHSNLTKGEIDARIRDLDLAINRIRQKEEQCAYDCFNQLAHEIYSYGFLKAFGKLKMAEDHRSQAGCDLVLNDSLYIECVCASAGDAESNGLKEYLGQGFHDYGKKKELLNLRLLSVLADKLAFYECHFSKQIPDKAPYVIFLSPGSLVYEWFEENYGIALCDVLFGRGNPMIQINQKTGEIRDAGYSHKDVLVKKNGTEVGCNIFLDSAFKGVSGILLSTVVGEVYSINNTFFFSNPNANNPIDLSMFPHLVCWTLINKSIYAPFQDGEQVEERKSGFI